MIKQQQQASIVDNEQVGMSRIRFYAVFSNTLTFAFKRCCGRASWQSDAVIIVAVDAPFVDDEEEGFC